MSRLAKCVALLAAFGVLVVLLTPIADELPCTTWHAQVAFAVSLNTISTLVLAIFLPETRSGLEATRSFSGTDLLSFTCTRLC
jgi:hypothetical protein